MNACRQFVYGCLVLAWSVALQSEATAASLSGFEGSVRPDTVNAAIAGIKGKLTEQGCTIYRVINHTANAENFDTKLNREAQVVLYGEPLVEEYLLQRNQLTALDMPSALQARVDAKGQVTIDMKAGSQVFDRHDIRLSDRYLRRMETKAQQFAADPGVMTHVSLMGFDQTVQNLVAAISANPNFVVAGDPIDFSAAALRPTKLVIAGAPRAGTALMNIRGRIGVELPLRILVWQDSTGQVNISYNEADWLRRQYDVEGADAIFSNMADRLRAFALAAGAIE